MLAQRLRAGGADPWQPGTEPGLLTIARSNPGSVPDSYRPR
jgi:hypothetical protein